MTCDPYVEFAPFYWVLGYAEDEVDCVLAGQRTKGFGGYSFTEEELRELAIADRRRRITQQIKELERQLAIERAWAETTIRDEIRGLEQSRLTPPK